MRTRRLLRGAAWLALAVAGAISAGFWTAVLITWVRHGCPP